MKINFDPNGQNNFLNVDRINQSLAKTRGNNQGQLIAGVAKQECRDKAVLSPMGKAASFLENLMKQKQEITNTKNELIGKTLENGGDIKDIKTQLETFDEQLKNLEEQITATMTESLTKEEDKEDKAESLINKEEAITKEEADAKKLENVTVQDSNVRQSEELFSIKNKSEAKVRLLNYEIEVDKKRGTYFNDGTPNSKEKMIEKLETSVEKIYTVIADANKGNVDIEKENNDITIEVKDHERKGVINAGENGEESSGSNSGLKEDERSLE